MPPDASWELTESMARDAARQMWRASASVLLEPRGLLVIGLVGLVTLLEWDSGWAWYWQVLFGFPLACYALAVLIWVVGYFVVANQYRARLAHLPHRRCTVAFDDEAISFRSATEKLSLVWPALRAIDKLPGFWLFRFPNDVKIPVPRHCLAEEDIEALRRHASLKAGQQPAQG